MIEVYEGKNVKITIYDGERLVMYIKNNPEHFPESLKNGDNEIISFRDFNSVNDDTSRDLFSLKSDSSLYLLEFDCLVKPREYYEGIISFKGNWVRHVKMNCIHLKDEQRDEEDRLFGQLINMTNIINDYHHYVQTGLPGRIPV